jgi:hypothetical protein
MMVLPHIESLLLNGSGTKSMVINGSVTPQVFSYTIASRCTLAALSILVADDANSSFAQFGGVAALANGLLVEVVRGAEIHQVMNVKDNADLCARFVVNHFGSSLVNTLGLPVGLGGATFTFVGHLPIIGRTDTMLSQMIFEGGDIIRTTVRDNLTGLSAISMGVSLLKETNL